MSKKEVKNEDKFSKYLSYILRHKPSDIGLELMRDGWVSTKDLINAINNSNTNEYIVDIELLKSVVKNDNKQRYSFKADSTNEFAYIRANQGHSIKDLEMSFTEVTNPPEYLYHGTSLENAKLIEDSGVLMPMSRQMVHLSDNIETALNVGRRHSKDNIVVFKIDTQKFLNESNEKIYVSDNKVYLVNNVNFKFLQKIIDK